MALPTRLVVTTNYDDLLEQALLGLRRYPERIVRREHVPRTAGGDAVSVVKFHGDARTGARIVLARDAYDRFFLDHPDMDVLLRGLLLTAYGFSLFGDKGALAAAACFAIAGALAVAAGVSLAVGMRHRSRQSVAVSEPALVAA